MKKCAVALAALLIVSLLGGCGSSAASSAEDTAAAETSQAEVSEEAAPAEETVAEEQEEEQETAEEPAEAPAEEPAEEPAAEEEPEEEEISYFPLEETKTFTYWFSYPPMFEGFADGPMDYLMYTESQERLNVQIEWKAYTILNASEQFMLMIASNDFADAMQNFNGLYSGGIDDAIENEIIIDLTDLLAEYAPDYEAQRTSSVLREQSSLTSSGKQGVMFGFSSVEGRVSAMGPTIRQDWLDDLGLDVPVTVDDYYTVLTAFKNEKGATAAYGLPADGTNAPGGLAAAYGIVIPINNSDNGYYQVDGEIRFGPIQDGFKQFVTTLNKWYSEGLISPDFLADTDSKLSGIPSDEFIVNGNCGIFTANSKNFTNYEEMITNADAHLEGIEPVRLNADDVIHLGMEQDLSMANMGISVSTQAQDPELIIRYFNYFFTDEGDILANYGVEGLTFEYNEDGVPIYTDLVVNNPDGMSLDVAMCLFGGGSTSGPYVIDNTKYEYIFTEQQNLAGQRWAANKDGAYDLPNSLATLLTADESEEFYTYYNEILTVYNENVLKFIVGDKSIDEFDDYVSQLQSLGIDRCTEIVQTAYDRYMAQ